MVNGDCTGQGSPEPVSSEWAGSGSDLSIPMSSVV